MLWVMGQAPNTALPKEDLIQAAFGSPSGNLNLSIGMLWFAATFTCFMPGAGVLCAVTFSGQTPQKKFCSSTFEQLHPARLLPSGLSCGVRGLCSESPLGLASYQVRMFTRLQEAHFCSSNF